MAGSNYFTSDKSGYRGETGAGNWNDFYKSVGVGSSRPTTAQMQAIRAVPSDRGPSSMSRAEMDAFNRQYSYYPAPQNSAVAAIDSAVPSIGPGPGPRPRPGYAPTVLDMAAINAQPAFPVDSAIPIPANPAVTEALAQRITVRGGNPAPVVARPKIAANALIDGQRGKDNMPGANYGGRSVGSDGVVRAYNQTTKRWDNLSQNSRKSPSQSYKKDSLGDRDMRQTRKAKYDY